MNNSEIFLLKINNEVIGFQHRREEGMRILKAYSTDRIEVLNKQSNIKVFREEEEKTKMIISIQALGMLFNGSVIQDSTYELVKVSRGVYEKKEEKEEKKEEEEEKKQ